MFASELSGGRETLVGRHALSLVTHEFSDLLGSSHVVQNDMVCSMRVVWYEDLFPPVKHRGEMSVRVTHPQSKECRKN